MSKFIKGLHLIPLTDDSPENRFTRTATKLVIEEAPRRQMITLRGGHRFDIPLPWTYYKFSVSDYGQGPFKGRWTQLESIGIAGERLTSSDSKVFPHFLPNFYTYQAPGQFPCYLCSVHNNMRTTLDVDSLPSAITILSNNWMAPFNGDGSWLESPLFTEFSKQENRDPGTPPFYLLPEYLTWLETKDTAWISEFYPSEKSLRRGRKLPRALISFDATGKLPPRKKITA